MKEIKAGLQKNGTFLSFDALFSNLFAVGTGRILKAMKDDKLGAFELHSSIN